MEQPVQTGSEAFPGSGQSRQIPGGGQNARPQSIQGQSNTAFGACGKIPFKMQGVSQSRE